MRSLTTMTAAMLLAAASLLPYRGAGAAGPAAPAHRGSSSFAPVVIEWMSVVQPKVGQHETVFARFVNNNKAVRGARMTASVMRGSRTLVKARGSATNAKGIARAQFKVPKTVGSKKLRVVVTLTYKHTSYQGANLLIVK